MTFADDIERAFWANVYARMLAHWHSRGLLEPGSSSLAETAADEAVALMRKRSL